MPKKQDNDLVDLNFKVSPDFRKKIRILAAEMDISHKELLERSVGLLEAVRDHMEVQ